MEGSAKDTAYERREYRTPPIAEALCELRFSAAPEKWNATIPGLYYEQVKNTYPVIVQQLMPGIQVANPGAGAQLTVAPVLTGAQFADENSASSVVISPENLAVTVAAPYPGWEEFLGRITSVTEAYTSLGLDAQVGRVGLRYVNHIRIEGDSVALDDYFVEPPITPESFPEHLTGVLARWESAYADDANLRLIYSFASVPTNDGVSQFVIDLDMFQLFPDPLPPMEALTHLTELKKRETAAFEAVIREPLREMFDG